MTENTQAVAFIGGGNMASAIIGGLLRRGMHASEFEVVEPFEGAREKLQAQFGIQATPAATAALGRAGLVVWAVKPQSFLEAASQVADHVGSALHLSVMAGIRSDSMAQALGTESIVRSMPNTPALVGKGMTALFPRSAVTQPQKAHVEEVMSTTGEYLWVDDEAQLDAVTALSGSGPAYVFYFLEAMTRAGIEMGLSREQAYRLSVGTFQGASALAAASPEPPEVLRERVTSKGGTTYAALTSMQADGVDTLFVKALHAACKRAEELGREFGA